jgi:DNA end-binding protein Ku
MARAIWKGHISFGLINIPVTLFSAENRSEIHFHMLDSRNNSRVRYERVNESTGEEVPWNSVVKAYEYDHDKFVLMKDEDFKHADAGAVQTVAIENFIDRSQMDCVYFDKPYMLAPGKKAEKGYVLLRETLKRTQKIGIAKVVIRTRQYIAALLPRGNGLLLNLLRYHQELKEPSEFGLPAGSLEKYDVSKKEVEMAEKFVDSMTADWKPETYKDEYRENLMKWIEAKIEAGGKEVPVGDEGEAPPTSGVDIMELLKQSIKKREESHGRSAERTGAGSRHESHRKVPAGRH